MNEFKLNDLDKNIYRVKIVPNKSPNADGIWTTVWCHEHRLSNYDYLNSILDKKDHHVVQVEL